MNDKEFDRLFREGLEDAEVQPSANLWNNIAEELKPRKTKSFSGYWIAAAISIIIASVALMTPEEEKIRLQGKPTLANEAPLSSSEVYTKQVKEANVEIKEETDTYQGTPLIIAPRLKEDYSNEQFAVKRQNRNVQVSPALLVDSIKVNEKEQSKPDVTELMMAKLDVPEENIDVVTESEGSAKGIKNVGDFVNYVVSKVDKREDKFLKFNTDDDHSSLVGINIGFIKLNLKRNK